MDDSSLSTLAASHGASVNRFGRVYTRGQAFGYPRKIEIAAAYLAAKEEGGGLLQPNLSDLERNLGVSRTVIRKVADELLLHGRVLSPAEIRANGNIPRGPGSKALDETDRFVVFFLYLEDSTRPLSSYFDWLCALTVTVVGKSTISRFFLEAFPHRGGLCKPNLVPYDKFRPRNMEKAIDYVNFISGIDPHRIKFGDEKHLKGADVFNRKSRRNPVSGEVPVTIVSPDFTNRYTLIGFCSIDPRTPPVWCSIHENTNDADRFAIELEYCIQSGFILAGDVLVLDNAAIHTGGENSILEDYLWRTYGIFLLFLPPRAPEWNPTELVWRELTNNMKKVSLAALRSTHGPHIAAHIAIHYLSTIPREKVVSFYKQSQVIDD